jgi:hypothetical protein
MNHPILAVIIGLRAAANALVITFPKLEPIVPNRFTMLLNAILYSYVAYVLW